MGTPYTEDRTSGEPGEGTSESLALQNLSELMHGESRGSTRKPV